jgi:putative dimethyl sulfoxide reductase chaperone
MYDITTRVMHHAEPIVRSSVYKLLALAFKYPTPEVFEAYRDGDFIAALWDDMSRLPHLQSLVKEEAESQHKVKKELEGVTFQDFEVGYTRTFDVGAPQPPCPPYEGVYRQGVERTALMIEVSEFYKHFGLAMSKEDGNRELPDHLSAELEFLHFLTFKEAQAMAEDTPDLLKGYVLAQKDFLERHMVSWLPKFCEKLQSSTKTPFFRELAGTALKFVQADFDLTKSRLEELDK